MGEGLTADQIADALIPKFNRENTLAFRELRLGSGYGWHERRIDLMLIKTGPATGNRATAYEIKLSRGDFTRDMRDPRKQRGAKLYSNEFYFAAPEGVLTPVDIPDWAGLVEIYRAEPPMEPTLRVRETVAAPYREKIRPSWPLLISVARNVRAATLAEGQ